jgi:hypothetical protein
MFVQAYPVMALLGIATVLPICYGIYVMIESPDARFFRPGRKQIFRGEVDADVTRTAEENEHHH